MVDTSLPPFLTGSHLTSVPGVQHGFFTRQGGASEGNWQSLNCGGGVGDSPSHVLENRTRAARALGVMPENLLLLHQIHSAAVVFADRAWPSERAPEADAIVTDQPGLALGILTADCGPVLLADGTAGVIGAAHAGWRGALAGVLEAVLEVMEERGANRSCLTASLGPCINQKSYEVGPEFPAPFLRHNPDHERFFISSPQKPDHFLFNLGEYVAARLSAAGVAQVEKLDLDTCAEADQFFSHRRSTLNGQSTTGRQLSVIVRVD